MGIFTAGGACTCLTFRFLFFFHKTASQGRLSLKKYSYNSLAKIFALFVAALPNLVQAATAPIGATSGSFSVSPSGAATYAIPIVVPPGTNGMAPKLSLNYNSQSGNGLAGMGWSIGGLSVIHRCGATIAIDGFKGGVSYDSNDKFCLDGERLIWVAAENAYHTQHESWQKITFAGSASNPTYFSVKAKNGTVTEYKTQVLAAGNPPSGIVRLWAISKVQDTSGNYLTINYGQDNINGDYWPTNISYNGNYVLFGYEGRSDVTPAYEAGSVLKTTQRLKTIKSCTDAYCTVNGSLVRTYNLGYSAVGAGSYDSNGAANRARLASVTECGADDVCLPSTQFNPGPDGNIVSINSTPSFGAPGPGNTNGLSYLGSDPNRQNFIDVNGDGLPDWLHVSGAGGGIVHLNNGQGGFNLTAAWSGLVYLGSDTTRQKFVDVNGDGFPDWVHISADGGGIVHLNNRQGGFDSTPSFGAPGPGNTNGLSYLGNDPSRQFFVDVNGDGLPDWVHVSGDGGLIVHLNNGQGGFNLTSSFGAPGSGNTNGLSVIGNDPSRQFFIDVNGDGLVDLVHISGDGGGIVYLNNRNGGFNLTPSFGAPGPGNTNGLAYLGNDPTRQKFIDVNGDGLPDWVHISGAGGGIVHLNNGSGGFNLTAAWSGLTYLGDQPSRQFFVDMNGDGLPDWVHISGAGGGIIHLNNGQGGFNAGSSWNGLTYLGTEPGRQFFVDVNGDGVTDWVHNSGDGGGIIHLNTTYAIPNLLLSVTTGLGVQTSLDYKPLTNTTVYSSDVSNAYKCVGYPCQDVQNAAYVVSQIRQSDGLGGTNISSMTYGGLKTHVTAGASLGFRRMQTNDPTGLVTTTFYNQITTTDLSLNGKEGTVASSTVSYLGTTLLKSVTNYWLPVALGNGRTLVVPASTPYSTLEQSYDLDGSVFPSVTTTYSNYDGYWNAQTITVSTSDGYSKTTANTYNNDATNWYLGQLTQSQVTASAPGQPNITRTSSFAYDALNRLTTETIEPNQSAYTLVTSYGYDSFGNRTSKTVSGADIVTRTESQAFDAQGQFVVSKTNALNQTETYVTDPRFGAVTQLTGPNGLITTWTYDGFGRKTGETRLSGTASPINTTISYLCWDLSVPASGTACTTSLVDRSVYTVKTQTDGAGDAYVYYDMLGRAVHTARISFLDATSNPQWVYSFTTYDNLGRVTSTSRPDFSNVYPAAYNTTFIYDNLGRVTSSTAPGNRVTTNTYNGLTTSVTYTAPNTQTQTKSTVKNSQGQVLSATDPAGTTNYQYDAVGNLTQVTDPAGNITTMSYNLCGFKTSMHDPDMGNWTYNYDVLGQLTSQVDAKNQTISMTYDKLGRMLTRVLPNSEGTSTWTYDTATKGIGKLASVTNPNANESYTYDSLGRLSTANTSISGTTYTVTTAYDTYSRIDTITYPETGFALKHLYNYGFLKEVKDASTNASYWKINNNGIDALNRILSETYGNGLIGTHVYNATTGDLSTIQTGISSNIGSIQNDIYSFDGVGNVLSRSWYDGTTTQNETFTYDSLNRLTQVTGPVNKTYNYDTIGNITFKSDVGNYNYTGTGCTRPHAVCSTSGGSVTTSFTYDANGNMLTGNGKTVTYTSFNKAKTIVKGSLTDTLTYDASFNRIIKSNSSSTTVYIGKLYERNTVGSTVTQKHYIYAGGNLIAAYSKVSSGTTNTRYFHTDHLGSVAIITNETGGVVQRLSYDAWGKRRNVNGTDAASITAQATRGFTGHEHDDEVSLINMNAREYDPIMGRFISPDTMIPGATNSQAFNRYTYTNNNPLSYTDPSGHFSVRKALQKIAAAVVLGPHASMAVAYVATHKQQIANFTSSTLGKVSQIKYVGGLLSVGLLNDTQFALAYGWSTGDWKSVQRAQVQGAKMAAAAYLMTVAGDVSTGWNMAAHATADGIAGGLGSMIQGGSFQDGFLGAGFGSLMGNIGGLKNNVAGRMLIGGLAARAGGGDFVGGAVMSGIEYYFNEMSHKWANPTGGGVRGCDDYGCGSFGASRDSGARSHAGVDYIASSGQDVSAVQGGTVTRIGYPYGDDLSLRYIEINGGDGYVSRQLYVSPAQGIARGTIVTAGQVIGNYQSLDARYPGITPHVHVEIRYNGNVIDPTTLIR